MTPDWLPNRGLGTVQLGGIVTDIPAKWPDLRDDPHLIAEQLVQEHGLERALVRATEGTTAAQEQDDNYGLSVWRDVKR